MKHIYHPNWQLSYNKIKFNLFIFLIDFIWIIFLDFNFQLVALAFCDNLNLFFLQIALNYPIH